jgi:hypothetical protein
MIEKNSKGETPPVSLPKTLSTGVAKETEKPPCQWFLGENDFCEKIKKNVKCGGNVKKCPF